MSFRETWAAAPLRHKVIWSGSALIVALVGLSAVSPDDPAPRSARSVTPVESACDMLRDGETPQFAYEVLKGLMDDRSYDYPNPDVSARLAVRMAEADGCG